MKHYDPGHDPMLHRIEPVEGTTADAVADAKQHLLDAHAKTSSDPVAELTFVTALIDQLEALHKDDPAADLSLSVKGAWTASVEIVVPPEQDDAAA